MILGIDQQRSIFESRVSFGTKRGVRLNWNQSVIRPRLDPPSPTVCIDNDLLPWACVAYSTGNRVHPLPATLRRGRNLAELDRRAGVGLTRLATGQAKAQNQPRGLLQQRVCRTTDPPKSPHRFPTPLERLKKLHQTGAVYIFCPNFSMTTSVLT